MQQQQMAMQQQQMEIDAMKTPAMDPSKNGEVQAQEMAMAQATTTTNSIINTWQK